MEILFLGWMTVPKYVLTGKFFPNVMVFVWVVTFVCECVCIVCECVCIVCVSTVFCSLGFSASKDGSVSVVFFTSANLFHRFSLFNFQDLIYQSSLVRGNRKKNSSRIVLLFLVDLSFVCFA